MTILFMKNKLPLLLPNPLNAKKMLGFEPQGEMEVFNPFPLTAKQFV